MNRKRSIPKSPVWTAVPLEPLFTVTSCHLFSNKLCCLKHCVVFGIQAWVPADVRNLCCDISTFGPCSLTHRYLLCDGSPLCTLCDAPPTVCHLLLLCYHFSCCRAFYFNHPVVCDDSISLDLLLGYYVGLHLLFRFLNECHLIPLFDCPFAWSVFHLFLDSYLPITVLYLPFYLVMHFHGFCLWNTFTWFTF